MKYVIVDIDGTIADLSHRLHHIKKAIKSPGDWDAFFGDHSKDAPIPRNIQLVEDLYFSENMYDIIFLTGRPNSIRTGTLNWLNENLGFPVFDEDLIMRSDGDRRPDHVAKFSALYEATSIDDDDIFLVLEDRDSMVEAWRKKGITCLQVCDGSY